MLPSSISGQFTDTKCSMREADRRSASAGPSAQPHQYRRFIFLNFS